MRYIHSSIYCCFLLLISIQAIAQSRLNVRPGPPTIEDQFPKKIGALRFSSSIISLGKLFHDEIRTDSLRIYNSGNLEIHILELIGLPSCISVNPKNLSIPPASSAMVVFHYDAGKKKEFGFVHDRFFIKTDDALIPVKPLQITAEIRERFFPPAEGDSLKLPKAQLDRTTCNFGAVKAGKRQNCTFVIRNTGGSELIIRKFFAEASAVILTVEKTIIKPGESAWLKAELDIPKRAGKYSRTANLILNDPLQSEIRLEMTGEITPE